MPGRRFRFGPHDAVGKRLFTFEMPLSAYADGSSAAA